MEGQRLCCKWGRRRVYCVDHQGHDTAPTAAATTATAAALRGLMGMMTAERLFLWITMVVAAKKRRRLISSWIDRYLYIYIYISRRRSEDRKRSRRRRRIMRLLHNLASVSAIPNRRENQAGAQLRYKHKKCPSQRERERILRSTSLIVFVDIPQFSLKHGSSSSPSYALIKFYTEKVHHVTYLILQVTSLF